MRTETTQPRTIILVKHARPQIIPTQAASEWRLGDEGRRKCAGLADALTAWKPEIIIASEELKARETAKLTAQRLGIPWRTAPGLHEHDRSNAPFLADETAFHKRIEALFAEPDAVVFGTETARAALIRFTTALDIALASVSERSIAVVAHGTVISLYVADRFGLDGFALWYRLGLPTFVVTDAPNHPAPVVVDQIR